MLQFLLCVSPSLIITLQRYDFYLKYASVFQNIFIKKIAVTDKKEPAQSLRRLLSIKLALGCPEKVYPKRHKSIYCLILNLIIAGVSKHCMSVPAADIHPNSLTAESEEQKSLGNTMNDNVECVA